MTAADRKAWVTVVVDHDTCLQALVLMKSLRRAMTTADIVVLVEKNVPEYLQSVLWETFDSALYFERKHERFNHLSALDEGKLFAWTLTMYESCILVDPSILILKNCDELFQCKQFSAFVSAQDVTKFDFSILTIHPSYEIYKRLTSLIVQSNQNGGKTIENIIKNAANENILAINSNSHGKIINGPGPITKNTKLWNSIDEKPWVYIYQNTWTELTTLATIWVDMFSSEVLPCLIHHQDITHKFAEQFRNLTQLKEGISKRYHNEIKDSIAIVGQSCRLPGANTVEEFWTLLENGGDGISSIPLERLPEQYSSDPRFTSIKAGFLKCPINEFDAKFFGISPREAAFMDPQQRLMVEVSWEALEDAAINPQNLKGSNTGVFSGIWTHEYEHLLKENTTGRDFHHVILGNAFSATSARVSYFLGLNGPNVATESGCSSSMVALHLACDSLRKRETDLALATGVNLLVHHFPHSEVPILAKDGHCKTFDETADGFSRAEGVVVMVVKRLADALRDEDRIYSIVRGSALSNEGTTSSFGTPSKHCQEIAITDALKVSKVKPENVDYVEAHGTGTPIGDPIEFAAISSAYKAEREKPLIIGSVKTNTGHTESAAGLAGLLKVNLALKKQIIPQHRNLNVVNPNIDLESLPAVIPVESMQWSRKSERRRLAGVSSFGISGTNVHVIVEESLIIPKIQYEKAPLEKTHHLLTLSAKTENALKDLVANYITHLEKCPELSCEDICYTTNTGRQRLKYRYGVVANNIQDLKQKLTNPPNTFDNNTLKEKPKVVFLFTGQGSQYSGMAQALYETNLIFKSAFNSCNRIIINNRGVSLVDVLWGEQHKDLAIIDETTCSQTAIFCIEYALLKLWESFGIKPDYVLGHSVGEYAASVAAGFMTLEEALALVVERSRLINNLPSGGMLAVRSNRENIDNMIKFLSEQNHNDWLDIAVVNSPNEIVVAGKESTLKSLVNLCSEKNIKTQQLAASHAFHSRDMDAMLKDFSKVVNQITFKSPNCEYVSGSTGKKIDGTEMSADYWLNHARYAVDFTKGIKFVHDEGCNVFVEIGAHPVLLALGLSNLSGLESQNSLWLSSIRKNEENWATMLNSVSKLFENGVVIDWERFHNCYNTKKVSLPHYPFQRQKYWVESKSELVSRPLHPLLGRKIPLAVVKEHVFQNVLDLSDFPYLRDHEVASVIVLPGAGFLEIILAAGKEAFHDDSGKVIIVENFLVEAPFELEEGKEHKIQIVASEIEDSESLMVRVFVYKNINGYNEEKGWKQFSSGTVSLADENNYLNASHDFQLAQTRCIEETDICEFYKKTAEIGINFGSTFQSISKIWKGDNELITEIPCPSAGGNMKEYIFHPIVIDAMIQTVGLITGQTNAELCLPVSVDNFTMVSKPNSKTFFAYAFGEEHKLVIRLYDEKSNLLSVMKGVRLVKTSIGSFMNVINAHKNKLPGMYEITWRYRDSALHSRVNLTELPIDCVDEVNYAMREYMKLNDEVRICGEYCEKYVRHYILIAFSNLGWKPKLGEIFLTKDFMADLMISRKHSLYLDRLLDILSEDEYLQRDTVDKNKWLVLKPLKNCGILRTELKDLKEEFDTFKIIDPQLPILSHCGEQLSNVLQGKATGVNTLFGNADPNLNPLVIYNQGSAIKIANLRIKLFLQSKFDMVRTKGSILRILEIGAGSGSTSKEILTGLQKQGIPCRYTFTDISPHFLEEAKEKLKNFSGIEYRVLNIENDPKYQGFTPHSFDVVVAANVLHATQYLNQSLQNTRQLLVPNGVLILQEFLVPIPFIDLIYGMVDGFWCFKDFDIRARHPSVNQEIWTKLLNSNGFNTISNISHSKEFITNLVAVASDTNPTYSQRSLTATEEFKAPVWVILAGKDDTIINQLSSFIKRAGDGVVIVRSVLAKTDYLRDSGNFINFSDRNQIFEFLTKINENYEVKGLIFLLALENSDDQELICRTTLFIAQYFATRKILTSRILCVTRGAFFIGDQGIGYPSQSTVLGIVKSLKNECPTLNGRALDLDPDNNDDISHTAQIFSEMWNVDNDFIVAYRNNRRFVVRVTALKTLLAPLNLPIGSFEIVVPKSKKINDVSFTSMINKTLLPNEVEIFVKATALNFRDIFVILKPESYTSRFEAVGTDLAGVVTRVGDTVTKYKIGDEVFGISHSSSAASHVVVHSHHILHKPKEFTFAEASTLPSVFLTAYLCLVDVANLKQGETILIHVASGGVGLVAIQISKYIGANIIATAGNKRKRTYLRSIGIQHVFHSRDLTFGDETVRATNGKGVDVVLNSLTGQGFKEASLQSCALNARFLEIGKVNIWQPEEVERLRPDIKYTIVDLEKMEVGNTMDNLMKAMNETIDTGSIKPLPYTRFFISQIKDALNYFLKAQHIGKIVVTMPELKESFGKHFTNDLLFNEHGTYLVTGGLGGIGLEVGKWMVKCGARNVVLVGRTAPDDKTKKILKGLCFKGCRVLSRQVDVGDFKQCEDLFSIIKSEMPPLRGVIHSAGTLSDGIISNQTWEKFQIVFNAKVQGGWNLHHLTKHLSLEHFVLFSSMAGVIGNMGQSNHAAANMFLDALAYYRHSLGLPAQSIDWGAWSEVGAATNTAYGKEGLFGIKPFSPTQGISALKFCMGQPIVQVGIVQMDLNCLIESFPSLTVIGSELLEDDHLTDVKSSAQAEQFWNDIEDLTQEERTVYIKKCIEAIIRKTLKLPESEEIDEHQTFSDMGLDSLMAVEMRNKLQQIFGKHLTLNPTSLLDYPTLSQLSTFLAEMTMSVNIESLTSDKLDDEKSMAAILELSEKDSVLPDFICKVSEPLLPSMVECILLTGATGYLAPYLLHELCKGNKTKIICLVRAKTLEAGRKRLDNNLKKFELFNCTSLKNVSIILGDISETNFGLKKEDYEKLACDVDAVFHCAAKANHIEKYKETRSKKDIRSVNVLGTREILKFAATLRTKRVAFASSFTAANVFGPDGFISDDLPSFENKGDGIGGGYSLTKFVGEKLMGQALKREIPCTVFRFPSLSGNSQTGHWTTDTNFIMNLLLTSGRLKVYREMPGGWYSMPVDVAAKISTDIFLNDNAKLGLYNVVDVEPMSSLQCVEIAKETGFTMTIVSEQIFNEKLLADESHMISIFKEAFGANDPTEFLFTVTPVFKYAIKENKRIFHHSTKLLKAVPDIEQRIPSPMDQMRRQIQFAKNKGMLDSFGIEYEKFGS